VFLRQGTLSAVPFNPDSLAVLGEEVPVLQMVVQVLTGRNRMDITGAGQFAIATTGTLAWVPGPVVPYDDATLVTVDRQGRVSPLAAPVRSYKSVRLSPDHRRLAVAICDLTERGLWVHDLDRPGTLTPLNRDGEVMWPLWSPDGQHLLFGWLTGGRRSLATQVATGTASPQVLMPGPFFPSSFTPDGRAFAGVRQPRAGQEDIVMVALEDGKARAQGLIETPQNEGWPELSPDGRWLAYVSNASGEFEVYVQPYPGPGRREPVSIGGGLSPAWHPNGHELFFASRDMRQMMAVEFIPGSPPRIGTPRRLFDHAGALGLSGAPVRSYDVAPDGQRFYTFQMQMPQPPLAVTQINLIENWFEELKAKVPTRR
jgi:Tol biopolymer transport system component